MQQAAEVVPTDVVSTQPVLCTGRHANQFKVLVQVVVGREVRPSECRGIGEENDYQADQGQTVAEQSPERVAPQASPARFRPVECACKKPVPGPRPRLLSLLLRGLVRHSVTLGSRNGYTKSTMRLLIIMRKAPKSVQPIIRG